MRRLPPAVWIAPLALIVLAALAFVVFGGGGGGLLSVANHDDTIPAFDFTAGRTTVESTTEAKKPVTATASAAAADATSVLDQLYTEAFLDPANWRDGSYDEVWSLFTEDAQQVAEQDAASLTVGSGGDAYEKIAQATGRVQVRVLLDGKDQAATAVATVRFQAVGTRTDGMETLFRSSGEYFLKRTDGGWHVYAFSVDRDDAERKPSPSPTGSGSAGTSS